MSDAEMPTSAFNMAARRLKGINENHSVRGYALPTVPGELARLWRWSRMFIMRMERAKGSRRSGSRRGKPFLGSAQAWPVPF